MEIDYQLALLLQHKFEQEAKKPKEYQSDIELARTLQEQFKTENEIETPKNGLVYKTPKTSLNSSKCLIDPSWEVIDPTPDIHVLFMAFNQRFFWDNLNAVCVSWSKRMTTCAGICSYQGRGGMCSITLSEPLLKLRPRKDLVETLLHEMIHAYLFVTHSNRDRDGHGPEFCKHMFRINKEAGTNITIYHDFFDEVRLYQQHWWRCQGRCQRYIRRAMNRAPGPNDRWWVEHTTTCGGSFLKVKEPEKSEKKGPAKENVKPKEDIRKYISVTKTGAATTSKPTSTVTSGSSSSASTSNIHTFSDTIGSSGKRNGPCVESKTNHNIHTFSDIGTSQTVGSSQKKNSPCIENKTNIDALPLSSTKPENDTPEYSIVRNHWLNKFSNGNNNGVKRKASENPAKKVPKSNGFISPPKTPAIELGECPICFEKKPLAQLNSHLDECLTQPKTENCIVCDRPIPKAEYDSHVNDCVDQLSAERDSFKPCSICNTMIDAAKFDLHAEKCLLEFYDDMEENYGKASGFVDCLACSKQVVRAELEAHLEVCNGLKDVFLDDNMPVETKTGSDEGKGENDVDTCVFCEKEVPKEELTVHMRTCLDFSEDERL